MKKDKRYKHNSWKHPSYQTWNSMMFRCYNKNGKYYNDYGGRGIIVEERWHDVRNFIADMGEKPKGLMLDRIDNYGNYCKENCRWSTVKEQIRNRRSSLWFTLDGQTKTLKEWCIQYNKDYHTVWNRIKKCGWTIEGALHVPVSLSNGGSMRRRNIESSKLRN